MPSDWPSREVTDAALQRLSPRFDRLYSTIGRPSIPPEKLLRALLLQMLYSIRSERLLMEELDYNILYRWFVGLSLDDPIWDATTFTKNRDRLLDGDVADAFFAAVLAAIKADGLLSDEHFTVDGTLAGGVGQSQELQTQRHGSDRPPDDPKNPTVNFHGRDAAERHAPVDDRSRRAALQESRRARSQARVSRPSADRESARLDRRHGGHGGERDGRTRCRDRHARRAAADDAAASRSAPTRRTTRARGSPRSGACTSRRTSPPGRSPDGGSAIDGRTMRHAGYGLSQRKRKLIEQAFGWMKTVDVPPPSVADSFRVRRLLSPSSSAPSIAGRRRQASARPAPSSVVPRCTHAARSR